MQTNDLDLNHAELTEKLEHLASRCAGFAGGDTRRALTQLTVTLGLLLAVVSTMIYFVDYALWLTLLLAVPAALLVVRLFIFQHDCGHDSFFSTRSANDMCGRFLSLFTMTPYGLWKREHAYHHASCGNLERRGVGDITTLTVEEYRARSTIGRLGYRIYRNPLFLFGFGTPLYFLVLQRLPWTHGFPARECWKSVVALDAALIVFYGSLAYVFGITGVALVVIPVVVLAAAAGGWLFFVQHQFEGTYWEHSTDWRFKNAAVCGSSYYVLPPVINWFTGHIGLHHIHHLNGRIPNYRLNACLDAIPEFKAINRISLRESLACVRLKLWDEDRHRLIGFAEMV